MKKILKSLPLIIIVLLFCLCFSYQNGYYDKYMHDKINLTNKSIEQFEIDIKEGRDVTIEDYLQENKNYSNKTTNMTLKVSNKLENIINKSIKYLFKKISSYVE